MHVDVRRTALLVLDLQRDVVEADGLFARNGIAVARAQSIVPAVIRVAEASRVRGVVLFASKFTVFTSPSGRPLGGEPLFAALPFLARGGFRHGEPGRELVAGLPAPDHALDKPRFSAFHATSLELLLSAREIRTLILTGVVSAVEATARDAILRDFSAVVLADCVAPVGDGGDFSRRALTADVRIEDSAAYLAALASLPAAPGVS
ncbi:MAG TPA: isochorismatase family cysteine hydrolase [Methylomirabilota bacterium]